MSDSIGLYIHIPFCKSKCPYCDFYSGKAGENEIDGYVSDLAEKAALWGKRASKPVSTVYIGGGTPSLLGAERLAEILEKVGTGFSVEKNAECTVEVNPESGILLDYSLLKRYGVNRISMGLQSACAGELRALGRIHTAENARTAAEKARRSGIENISLDLMLGIPHQTKESLAESIDFCRGCGAEHISAYILKIEKGTYFDRIKDRLPLPDDDAQADLYLEAAELLEKYGYNQYEISNFAKPGFESRHNTSYWKCREYIGIGPSAHSFFGGRRFHYGRNMSDFRGNITIDDGKGGSESEFIMLSLRLKSGLVFDEYEKKYGKPVPEKLIEKAKLFSKAGYAEVSSKGIRLTRTGFLVSNSIIAELI